MGSCENRLGGFNNAIDERDRMENGIAGDKVFDVLKIVPAVSDQLICAIERFFFSARPV